MSLRFGVLTISDRSSRGERADASGPALVELVKSQGWQVVKQEIVPDEIDVIQGKLQSWADSDEADVIITTGGTGFTPRDVTPEATRAVVERLTPGLDEAMRAASLQVTPHAMLSRAISGIRKCTLIVNLPGSPKGATENLQVVLPALEHAVKLLKDEDAGH
jgi:molybdenum cofactor synthesis domain-containing protein